MGILELKILAMGTWALTILQLRLNALTKNYTRYKIFTRGLPIAIILEDQRHRMHHI